MKKGVLKFDLIQDFENMIKLREDGNIPEGFAGCDEYGISDELPGCILCKEIHGDRMVAYLSPINEDTERAFIGKKVKILGKTYCVVFEDKK